MKELVSIITPLYNYEEYIGMAIKSVLSQTYPNWEMIIVNDCSTDQSEEVVKSYTLKDKRIRLISLRENKGVANAKNTGLKTAKGNLIAFLDSDDIWHEKKLEKQVRFMVKNNCPISFTSYELIDSKGKKMNKVIPSLPLMRYKDYLKNTLIGFSTSMINRSITGEINFINLRSREDTFLWIDLLRKGFTAYGIEDVLVQYRTSHKSLSSNKLRAAVQVWNLYYKTENLSFIKTLYYFSHYAYNAFRKNLIR